MLELFSEQVGPSGGASADTMGQAIASTHYDLVQTVLREALQNSCDYRTSQNSLISFSMSVFAFRDEQVAYLNQALSPDLAARRALGTKEVFASQSLSGLLITDSGTVGLAGSINPSVDHSPDNFTGFFFRMGRDTQTKSGGGSAGVGRAAFFSFSECSTSLIYSRYIENGVVKSRFMGMALGPSFVENGFKFTGRHWYCAPDSGSSPAPIEGREADEIANLLGMDSDFHYQTGTAILIIQPKLHYAELGVESNPCSTGEELRTDLARKLLDATVLFAWPHILDETVDFHFKADGKYCEIPSLSSVPCIQDFVSAYNFLQTKGDEESATLRHIRFNERDNKVLGKLSWVETLNTELMQRYQDDKGIPQGAVALIRQAKFIVKYLPVSTRIDSTSIRGVFLSDEKFEEDFRKSEPAAHDEWLPERLGLAPRATNPVRQALEKIQRVFKELRMPAGNPIAGSSLVGIANRIGQLFAEDGIQGPPRIIDKSRDPNTGGGGGGGGRTQKASLVEIGGVQIVSRDRQFITSEFEFMFDIDNGDERKYRIGFKVTPTLSDQPIETSAPVNAKNPELVSVACNGEIIDFENHLLDRTDGSAKIVARVKCPPEMAVADLGLISEESNVMQ